MNTNLNRCLIVSGLAVLTSGCIGGSPKVAYLKDKAEVPNFVAILPPVNDTSDGAAPDTVRRASAEMLLSLGIVPMTSPAQDKQLVDMNVYDGTQLSTATEIPPQKLAEALGVDGLLYITITQFHDFNAVAIMEREVAATLKLVDRMGNKVWEIEGTGYNRSIDPNPQDWVINAGKLSMSSVGLDVNKMLEKALNVHLLQESQQMTGFMRPLLPDWPRSNLPAVDLAADAAAAAAKTAKKQ